MSFNQDLERGYSGSSRPNAAAENEAFSKLQSSVSMQIFKINSNISGIEKLIEKLGGKGDGKALRNSLTNLLESTREMVKNSTQDVKTLVAFPSTPATKQSQQKISLDFAASVNKFQKIQKLAAQRQRTAVEAAERKIVATEEHERLLASGAGEGEQLLELEEQPQQVYVEDRVAIQDIEFQESIIAERENEIRGIETGVLELNEIMRDLSKLVGEQGGMIDNIETNISSVATHTAAAATELDTAHDYQRKAGKRMLCLMLILIVVVTIVLVAILS